MPQCAHRMPKLVPHSTAIHTHTHTYSNTHMWLSNRLRCDFHTMSIWMYHTMQYYRRLYLPLVLLLRFLLSPACIIIMISLSDWQDDACDLANKQTYSKLLLALRLGHIMIIIMRVQRGNSQILSNPYRYWPSILAKRVYYKIYN